MADIQHSAITDPNVHEPKGAATANVGEVYISDGGGSGSWGFTDYVMNVRIDDISTADSVYVVAPFAGTISKISIVIDSAISVANTTIVAKINTVAVTNGSLVVPFSGSAIGDVITVSPTATNTVAAGDAIEFACDGASTGSSVGTITIVMKRT